MLKVKVGLYKARCDCQRVFESFHPELPKGWRFSRRVRELAVRGVVRDKLSVEDVRQRLREDFLVEVSEGCVHEWLAEAGGKNRSGA
jgi:transposase-like protein